MTIDEKIKKLRAFSLFKDLSEADLLVIAREIKEEFIPQETIFIAQEDSSDNVFFIVSGAIRVFRLTEDGEEINVSLSGPGAVAGEMSLIDETPRSANVETLKDCEVFILTGESFKRILKTLPDVAINLLKVFSQRLRENNDHIEEVLSQTLAERTWKTLCALRKIFPDDQINLSQEELSFIVGATRARITESLNTLESEGKISLSHRKIHIL